MVLNWKSKKREPADHMIVNKRFGMIVPSQWKDTTTYTFEGPQEDGIRHNIFVTIENQLEVTDLDEYADMQTKAVETELQGYHGLKQGLLTLKNRHSAYEHVYRWSPVENREVYQRVMYVLHNNTGYVISSTSSKKTWKTLGTEVDKILMSFAIP